MDSLIKDIKDGKISFDVAIATPAVMPKIAVTRKRVRSKGFNAKIQEWYSNR
jgi:ribosomal protein L1